MSLRSLIWLCHSQRMLSRDVKLRTYEANRHWQDSWTARLPWAESVLGRDGRVVQVRCKICTDIMGREKLLVPKIDSLWKHVGKRKALANMGHVKQGDYYFLTKNQHAGNKHVYFARQGNGGDTII